MATVTPATSSLVGTTAANTTAATTTATTASAVSASLAASTTLATTTTATPATTATGATATTIGIAQPTSAYKWNLPPHDWSLPVRPASIEPLTGNNEYTSFHGLRRGRLWFWAGASDISTITSAGTVTTLGATVTAAQTATGSTSTTAAASSGTTLAQVDNAYGFQFLWNPTSISTSVTRNMNITPSPADTLKVVAGAFPGQETVSLTIQLDRVNDFACIKAFQSAATTTANPTATQNSYITIQGVGLDPRTIDYSSFTKYYTNTYPNQSNEETTVSKIQKLMAQGTMADLEYLFKAVNGGAAWTNLLGKETANIGFLMPTLLGIQLGPTLDNLNYVGWITSLGIQHTDFTENMIPVRTTVQISIDCFSGSGITVV